MSRFSAESWRLLLGRDHWHFDRAGEVQRVPAGADPAAALAGVSAPPPVRRLLRRPRLEVELADDWVRHLVVQWPRGLRGQERAAWLGDRFAAVHELDPAEWVFAADCDADGERALASAAPRVLVAAVMGFAKAQHATIDRFGSRFALGFNRARQALDGECGVFALCAEDRLTVGLWQLGEWVRVRSLAAGLQPGVPLAQTLAGWLAALPPRASEGVVYSVGVEPAFLPSGWQQRALPLQALMPTQPQSEGGIPSLGGWQAAKGTSR